MALTANKVPRFKGAVGDHQQIQDSAITDDGSTIALARTTAVTGNLTVSGTSTLSDSAKIIDDKILTLGTTVTNAATKVTLTHDKTASGISKLVMGTSTNPQVLVANPGADVFGITQSINHSLGLGDCANLIGHYNKVTVTGDVGDPDMTVVGSAPRVYIGVTGGANDAAVAEAYGVQCLVNHKGTGAINALVGQSTVLNIGADNFTAASQVQGMNVTLDGTATVTTAKIQGISVDVKAGVVADSAINLDCQTTTGAAVQVVGAPKALVSVLNGAKIFTGAETTHDGVYGVVGAYDGIGSIYLSTGTGGKLFVQVANNAHVDDWTAATLAGA